MDKPLAVKIPFNWYGEFHLCTIVLEQTNETTKDKIVDVSYLSVTSLYNGSRSL